MKLAIASPSLPTIVAISLSIATTINCAAVPNSAQHMTFKRAGPNVKYYQLHTTDGSIGDKVCTNNFVEATVADRWKNKDTDLALKDIDRDCKLHPISKSFAELASKKHTHRYLNSKDPELKDIRPEQGIADNEPYIEVICETSAASPTIEDVKALQKNTRPHACGNYLIYDWPSETLNIFGSARVEMCRTDVPFKEEGFSPDIRDLKDKTVFTVAEETISGVHRVDLCWIRQYVLPILVLKYCQDPKYPGKVGGMLRFGSWVNLNQNRGTGFEKIFALVWVLDLKVYNTNHKEY